MGPPPFRCGVPTPTARAGEWFCFGRGAGEAVLRGHIEGVGTQEVTLSRGPLWLEQQRGWGMKPALGAPHCPGGGYGPSDSVSVTWEYDQGSGGLYDSQATADSLAGCIAITSANEGLSCCVMDSLGWRAVRDA